MHREKTISFEKKMNFVSQDGYPLAVPVFDNPLDYPEMIFSTYLGPVVGKSFFDYENKVTDIAISKGAYSQDPYNIILLYDVLDHVENPVELLKELKGKLKENGSIFVHCHPWCARDAMHLLSHMNRAYLHLVFTEDELGKLGMSGRYHNKQTINPLPVYRKWFYESGLRILYEEPITCPVESAFLMPAGRIFTKLCSDIQFVDYILCYSE